MVSWVLARAAHHTSLPISHRWFLCEMVEFRPHLPPPHLQASMHTLPDTYQGLSVPPSARQITPHTWHMPPGNRCPAASKVCAACPVKLPGSLVCHRPLTAPTRTRTRTGRPRGSRVDLCWRGALVVVGHHLPHHRLHQQHQHRSPPSSS